MDGWRNELGEQDALVYMCQLPTLCGGSTGAGKSPFYHYHRKDWFKKESTMGHKSREAILIKNRIFV